MEDAPETATQQGDRIMSLAIKNYRRDARFAALTDSAAQRAMDKFGRIDPRDAREAAFSIAREAVAFALTAAFDEDAELKHAREMLEKMQAMMLRGMELSAAPIFINGAGWGNRPKPQAAAPSPVKDPR